MRKTAGVFAIMLLVAVVAGAAQSPSSTAPHVTQIIVFDAGSSAGVGKLVEFAKRARSIAEKAGSTGKARLWSVAFGGSDSGHIVVAVEFPSMVSFAESGSRMQTNPEWQKMNLEAEAAGLKIISTSLAVEIPY